MKLYKLMASHPKYKYNLGGEIKLSLLLYSFLYMLQS